ncbi:HAD hydrolase family protein [Planktothrix sp. FACHB-1365]|uniref:HAD hydrolase family protein n=1 Tax=Planktothrix sp. FACHB-1365 TaxID=2692855 RepID=UPI0016875DBA|nr:HAD hydrolase family protein [Planktothrix sp. FACHB-1365]MBD2484470.1 HAD hydrolase family protein [Planktothrix sp. FACHB-1365]
MSLIPLTEAIQTNALQHIRLIATDIDGTLTKNGKFTTNLLQALSQLKQAKIPIILITGRSAGWVQALKHYLPVSGAIAENGGLFYPFEFDQPQFLISLNSLSQHRQNLAQAFQILQVQYPNLQASADNFFRFTDWTFEIQNISLSEIQLLTELCEELGWGFTYSTVQGHIKPKTQDKATGLLKVIQQYWSDLTPEQILTIGDSPNDQTLFNSELFPQSVGVANILDYSDQLTHKPRYVTAGSEVEGFCEIVNIFYPFLVP